MNQAAALPVTATFNNLQNLFLALILMLSGALYLYQQQGEYQALLLLLGGSPGFSVLASTFIFGIGVMQSYGSTISFGCNIGAYFSGIVSGSLHGWLWLVAAFAGSMVGTQLRPLFRLDKTA